MLHPLEHRQHHSLDPWHSPTRMRSDVGTDDYDSCGTRPAQDGDNQQ